MRTKEISQAQLPLIQKMKKAYLPIPSKCYVFQDVFISFIQTDVSTVSHLSSTPLGRGKIRNIRNGNLSGAFITSKKGASTIFGALYTNIQKATSKPFLSIDMLKI
jgi:hypothetical protein